MTAGRSLLKMTAMRKIQIVAVLGALLTLVGSALGQKNDEEGPTSWLNFVVVKDDNGKPVRNASVIMHPVSAQGKQEKGGMELKTDADGKADFDGIPYGKLRVQVLATGFQTYGEDFDVEKPKMAFTIKMKRPQGQFSVYEDHSKDSTAPPKQDAPPPDQPPPDQKKPN
jgi:hypothetical protein